MNRVFLDANVLFSAAISEGGVCRAIFEVAGNRDDVHLVCTGYAREEARFNLRRKYPGSLDGLDALLDRIDILDEPPEDLVEDMSPLVPDPDDGRILAGAVASGAFILVTGNSRDFGELYGTRVRGVAVMRPREALEFLIS